MVSMLFLGTPKFRKSRFLLLSPGPLSAPELTFAHAAMKDFISDPSFLVWCSPDLWQTTLSRNIALSDPAFSDRKLCHAQHNNPDIGVQPLWVVLHPRVGLHIL